MRYYRVCLQPILRAIFQTMGAATWVAGIFAVTGSMPAKAQDSVLDRVSSAPIPPQDRPGGKDSVQRLEDIRFKVPSGWKMVESNINSRTFLAPDNTPGKETVILLLRGPEFQGDFRSTFDKAVTIIMQDRTILKKLDVQTSRSSEGHEVLTQAVVSEDKQGQRTAALIAATNVNRHMLAIGYVATTQELFNKYAPVMTKFLADLSFPPVKAGATESAGATAPAARMRPPEEVARDEETRRKPGKVTGRIYDAQGRPFAIPGSTVQIHVWGVTAAGERTFFDGEPDAQGRYEIPVVHGLYSVNCTAKMPLGNTVLSIALEVLDGKRPSIKEDSTPGICKDFGLKLTGPVFEGVPGTYHGGYITLTDGGAYHSLFDAMTRRYPAGTVVKLTLTPHSRVIDGSPASSLTLTYNIGPMQTGQTMGSIPLALYTATARLVTPNGQQKALKIGLFPGDRYGDSVDVVFTPERALNGQPTVPNLVVAE